MNPQANKLLAFVERVERLQADKKAVADDIKSVFGEIKAAGFDPPTTRKIIALRAMDEDERQEKADLLKLYAQILGLTGVEAIGIVSKDNGTDAPRRSRRSQASAAPVS